MCERGSAGFHHRHHHKHHTHIFNEAFGSIVPGHTGHLSFNSCRINSFLLEVVAESTFKGFIHIPFVQDAKLLFLSHHDSTLMKQRESLKSVGESAVCSDHFCPSNSETGERESVEKPK